MDLSYRGFEVTVSTESIAWTNVSGTADATAAAAAEEDRRVFEIMLTPANAALHRYIKDLAHVCMELAALQTAKDDAAVNTLEMCVKEEQEVATSWMKRFVSRRVGWVLLIRRLVRGSEAERWSGNC